MRARRRLDRVFARVLFTCVAGGTAAIACGTGSTSTATNGGDAAPLDGSVDAGIGPIGVSPGQESGGGDFDVYAVCGQWTVPIPAACGDGGAADDDGGDASDASDSGITTPCPSSSMGTVCEAICNDSVHGPNGYYCRLEPGEGGATVYQCANECASSGRRYEGFVLVATEGMSRAGAYFAEMAQLEAASVPAFERLAKELGSHAAPASLIKRALAAANDERRHARVAQDLAARYGAVPHDVAAPSFDVRALVDVARENAIEGCVRETYAALEAHHQAMSSDDSCVRAALERIAVDETAHAELAWDVHAWAMMRLTDSERADVLHAQREAVAELRVEISRRRAESANAANPAGLPSPNHARALLDNLAKELNLAS